MDEERREEIERTVLAGAIMMLGVAFFIVIPAELLYEPYGWVGAVVGGVSIPGFFIIAYPVGKVVLWVHERIKQ